MRELHHTEVDGVATVWADCPGPLRGGLLFRAGRTDESLLTGGRLHLIEHLALSRLQDSQLSYNGFVGSTICGFQFAGSPEEVGDVLSEVCAGLTSPFTERLEVEKRILEAEAETRGYDPVGNLMSLRYGARSHGLVGWRELGLQSATAEDLRKRARHFFTRENAMMWLSGPPPATLKLDLPSGKRLAIRPLEPVNSSYPCWFVDDMCGGIAASMTVPRTSAATVFNLVAMKRLGDSLRTDRALSYAPRVLYGPMNGDAAHFVLLADSKEEMRRELSKAFAEVYEGFDHLTEEEVEAARAEIARHHEGSMAPAPEDAALDECQRFIHDSFFEMKHESLEEIAAGQAGVSLQDVTDLVVEMKQDMILALPGDTVLEPWMGVMAERSCGAPPSGRGMRHVDAPVTQARLTHDSEGVGVLFEDGSHATVRYDDLAAAFTHDDGAISLVGNDGVSVMLEPTLWHGGKRAGRKIRRQLSEEQVVDLGARPKESIPKGSTTFWKRFRVSISQQPLLIVVVVGSLLVLSLALMSGSRVEWTASSVAPLVVFVIIFYQIRGSWGRR